MAGWLELISRFRFIGSATWQAGIVHLGLWALLFPLIFHHGFFSNAWRPAGVLALATLIHAMQLAVLWVHRLLLASCLPQPFHVPKVVVLGIPLPTLGGSWISLLLSRLVFRTGTSKSSRGAHAMLLASAVMTAIVTVWGCNMLTGPGTHLPLGWIVSMGSWLGVLHTADHLLRGKEVVRYPAVHRHRFHRLKAEFVAVTWRSVRLAAASWILATASVLLRGGALPSTFPASLWGGAAALLVVLGWQWGSAVLQVVHSEPVALAERGDVDLNGALLQALGSPDMLMQDLALHDLATFAEARGGTFSQERRAAIFADPSGRAVWAPIAGFLAGELKDVVAGVTAALPAIAGELSGKASGSSDGGSLSHGIQWNQLRLTPIVTAPRQATREQELAAWLLQARYQRASFCMRALSGLASASMNVIGDDAAAAPEDRYGVVLMSSPNLGEIVLGLTSCVLALQQYGKMSSAQRSGSGSGLSRVVDHLPAFVRLACGLQPADWCVLQSSALQQAVQALEDTARSCLYRLVAAYGTRLLDAVAEAKPWCGSASENMALLAACLRYEA